MKKLDNEKFVNNAPESVVAIENKKRSEAEQRIAVLEKQIESLTN
jgi:valyl-tRNA synthetase